MLTSQIITLLEEIAPPAYAEPWDNVGLLIGSSEGQTTSMLLTIDLSDAVLQEALDGKYEFVLAYHPPIFKPLARLTDRSFKQRIALTAAREGVVVYSPHTALDAAPGGVNDWLAEAVGAGDVRALTAHEHQPASEACKIVTFCPADAVDALRNALASVGAGRIGGYERCSFEIHGQGTFHGGEATSPVVGESGRLERVDEVRLEMVCSQASLSLAVIMLQRFHPYEEPPIEIYPLLARPMRTTGQGRRVMLDQKVDLTTLADRLKSKLGVKQVRVAVGDRAPRKYSTIGLCAGAGGAMLDSAVSQGCELFLTGEMRHHDVLEAQAHGCTVILAGHTNTERGYLRVLKKRLAGSLPEVNIAISRRDADPMKVY